MSRRRRRSSVKRMTWFVPAPIVDGMLEAWVSTVARPVTVTPTVEHSPPPRTKLRAVGQRPRQGFSLITPSAPERSLVTLFSSGWDFAWLKGRATELVHLTLMEVNRCWPPVDGGETIRRIERGSAVMRAPRRGGLGLVGGRPGLNDPSPAPAAPDSEKVLGNLRTVRHPVDAEGLSVVGAARTVGWSKTTYYRRRAVSGDS